MLLCFFRLFFAYPVEKKNFDVTFFQLETSN